MGPDSARRVRFFYGSRRRQLAAISEPGVARPDSIQHDDRGNPVRTISSLGVRTEIVNDSVGRVEKIYAPIDSTHTKFKRTWHSYDLMDRIYASSETAPTDTVTQATDTSENGDPIPLPPPGSEPDRQSLLVTHTYDPEGNVLSVSRLAIPSPGISHIVTSYAYDAALRRVKEITPDGAVDSTVYDLGGNPIAVHTRRTDPTSGERIVVRMTYDASNRLTERRAPEVHYPQRLEGIPQKQIRTAYDSASSPYPSYPNDGSTGYLVQADTARYTYDVMGKLLTAENRDARVNRSYHPNGLLRTDTLRTRTVAELSSGGSFTAHVYGTETLYDLDGRRTELKHLGTIAPVVGGVLKDRNVYAYEPGTGMLSSVTDPLGNEFGFLYNTRGILRWISRPGPVSETYSYDDGGRLTSNTVNSPVGPLRSASFVYDIRDKLLRTTNPAGNTDTLSASYSDFGHLASGGSVSWGRTLVNYLARSTTSETVEHDAMGNQTSSSTQTSVAYTGYSNSTAKSQGYRYQYGTGRLLGTPKFGQIDTVKYDASGNEVFHKDEPTNGEATSYHRDRASYYSAGGQLRAAETRYIATGDVQTAAIYTRVFEEFRYDALGRRILSRSRNWCEKDPDDWEGLCRQSKLRRMVWDGDEELYEIQMPGGDSSSYLENDTAQVVLPSFTEDLATRVDPNRFYGRVAYTHALGIDQPVAITRINYADRVNDNFDEVPFMARAPFMVSPLWNERGQMYSGTYVDGETLSCQPESGVGADTVPRCIHFGSAASWFAYVRDKHKRSAWHGSLLEDRAEQSGILYRRNRYYDPEKGKFTQEDPIGLAGGVNLYGFANGDPVNYSDPFGLCPSCVGAALGVAQGWAISKIAGEDYGLSQAVVDAGLGAAGVGLVSKLNNLRRVARFGAFANDVPNAADPRLQRAISDIFRPGSKIPGGTAGAIRQERRTGVAVGGKFHTVKGEQSINRLHNIMKTGQLSAKDRRTAERITADLREALRGN